MKQSSAFRSLMSSDKIIVAPGAYDGITARLIEYAGFPAVYMTGAGTAATLGYPDFGLVTMTEMVANAATLLRGKPNWTAPLQKPGSASVISRGIEAY
jgi:2-methylisocitrate lyase-like PEP mutase family enzyme